MIRILGGLLLFLIVSAAGSAATISFTNRSAWLSDAMLRGLHANSPFDLGTLVMTGDSIVVPQVSGGGVVVTPLGTTQLVVADRDASGYDFGVAQVISAQLGFSSSVAFALAPGTFGFGFDVGGFPATGEFADLRVHLLTASGPHTLDFTGLGGPTLSFLGFTSEVQIHSVSLTGGAVDPVFANITTAAVPEPATNLLVSGAMAFVLLWRRRGARLEL